MTALATDSGRKTPARLAGSAILSCQSDERLVKLVRSGHERAFDTIVQRYRTPLVAYCRRILPESRCEDAVQQAFINAHAALIDSDDAVQLKPWLYAITRNAALNMLRQNGWNYDQIPADFDGVPRPDQVFEQRFELQQTVAAMNDLPERQRDALVMREFEGRSYDEIALALGTGDGAVRQLLNRARVTLRNAATLLTPPPLLARAAASMPPADGRRAAEVFAGLGAAGVAKAGATALVAGSLVVGAVSGPLPLTDHNKPAPAKASVVRAKPAADDTPVALHPSAPAAHSNVSRSHSPVAPVSQHSGSGHSGSGETEHHGSGERERSGDDTRKRSGSGGSDDGSRQRSGSDDSSTSGSGTSGRSGSDDGAAIVSDDSITTSGTSGKDTSGTSGSSGSTSGTSGGSDDLTTSGSSGSGSGSSGSGSGETTTTTTSSSGSSGTDD